VDRSLGYVLSMTTLTTRPLQPQLSFMTNSDGAADGGAANVATFWDVITYAWPLMYSLMRVNSSRLIRWCLRRISALWLNFRACNRYLAV